MKINYNVTGADRKEMVNLISDVLGGVESHYLGVPSCAYRVGDFEISRDGALTVADDTDRELVRKIVEALAQAGLESEDAQTVLSEEPAAAHEEESSEVVPPDGEATPTELSISLQREPFTETALDNLDNLLTSKGAFIKKAFGIENPTYTLTDEAIIFDWLKGEVTPEMAKAGQDFISKLCEMARTQKRVTSKAKVVENEKYAFRCFLLRLGMIGAEYKETRKILLRNLSGNSSFKVAPKKEAEEHEISE